MRRRLGALALVCAGTWVMGCEGAPAPSGGDAGDGGTLDAGDGSAPTRDTGGDAGDASACLPVTLGAFRLEGLDDVSVDYVAPVVELVSGQVYALHLTFERYGGVDWVGTFSIEGSADANRSTCAHCVMAFSGLTRDRGFFASTGALELDTDPFDLSLDARLRGLRLVEVTIGGATLESTPVPGGRCLDVADVEVHERFAPPGWTCPAARYADGTTCHCACGLLDPDCDGSRAPADCAAGDRCELRRDGPLGVPFCASPCSRASGVECARGVCAVDPAQLEYCDPAPMLRADVPVGADCPASAVYCAPVGASFFDGICDVFVRADGVCRARCATDADCDTAALEQCAHLFGDPGIGLCAPRYPASWTCAGASYGDGAYCDCACGAHDIDCDDTALPLRHCAAGEVCTAADECAAVPANDTCATSVALPLGTVAAPAHVAGTTRGATNDYATQPVPGSCLAVLEEGPDVVYGVSLGAGQTLTVTALGATNVGMYLLGPGDASSCDATATRCVAGQDVAGFGEPEVLSFTATTTGSYFLVIDAFAATTYGDFTLDVSVAP